MAERVDKAIREAVRRFSGPLSMPIDTRERNSLSASLASAVSSHPTSDIVQIGLDHDSVALIDPTSSEVISQKPKTEAYRELIDGIEADRETSRNFLDETMKMSRSRSLFGLVAAGLGFLIVVAGVVSMLLGYSTAGTVTSASGVISELVSVLFINEARRANGQLQGNLDKLLETEGYFRAFAIAEQIPEGESRNQLMDAIVRKIIGISQTDPK